MELPDVGRRCSKEGCQRLDFLAAQKKVLTPEQQQALALARRASSARSRPPSTPAGSPAVSPKIELMRLKAKATGNASIADADRVYLSIQWRGKATPVFLNANSVVGNAAAQLARQLRLTMLPDRLYRLLPPGASEPLASNKTFRELMANDDAARTLFNGCTLELSC
ncbi:hypothetical protein IWQ57_000135 [Coemansia nantahalensis]|uniref:Uncharacterized protein n=1 Tax=Coemansia nantahalensis TaxID=2789366 RepID=A0ACC1K934_9FUNG|nr:hypothetical protein IWQ57_000135 [Coemansia nantahalensis]